MGSKRERNKKANKLFKKSVTKFKQIDLLTVSFVPEGMTRAFSNNRYTVMIYDNTPVSTGVATRVMIQKHNDTPILNHWKELQNLKNDIFGEETTAIEYYPPQSKLIDDFNIYWLWIFPENTLPMPIL